MATKKAIAEKITTATVEKVSVTKAKVGRKKKQTLPPVKAEQLKFDTIEVKPLVDFNAGDLSTVIEKCKIEYAQEYFEQILSEEDAKSVVAAMVKRHNTECDIMISNIDNVIINLTIIMLGCSLLWGGLYIAARVIEKRKYTV